MRYNNCKCTPCNVSLPPYCPIDMSAREVVLETPNESMPKQGVLVVFKEITKMRLAISVVFSAVAGAFRPTMPLRTGASLFNRRVPARDRTVMMPIGVPKVGVAQ